MPSGYFSSMSTSQNRSCLRRLPYRNVPDSADGVIHSRGSDGAKIRQTECGSARTSEGRPEQIEKRWIGIDLRRAPVRKQVCAGVLHGGKDHITHIAGARGGGHRVGDIRKGDRIAIELIEGRYGRRQRRKVDIDYCCLADLANVEGAR